MIVKFLASKISKGANATKYLLDKDKREQKETAKILIGDRKLTDEIIANNKFSQKAALGVLSFEEKNISEKAKFEIMKEFEKILLPHVSQEEYNILWVEHIDKGRLELNFVIPKINLRTYKSLQVYYHQQDMKRIDLFKKKINIEHNLSEPESIFKAQTFTKTKNKKQNKLTEELESKILEQIEKSTINNRTELIEYLKLLEIDITRVAKESISIKFQNSKKAIKLTGLIYNEQFTNVSALRESYEELRKRAIEDKKYREESDRTEELNKIETELNSFISYKINSSSSNSVDNHTVNENSDNRNISEILASARNEEKRAREEELARAELARAEEQARKRAVRERERVIREREEEELFERERAKRAREQLRIDQERNKILEEKNKNIRREARKSEIEHRYKFLEEQKENVRDEFRNTRKAAHTRYGTNRKERIGRIGRIKERISDFKERDDRKLREYKERISANRKRAKRPKKRTSNSMSR